MEQRASPLTLARAWAVLPWAAAGAFEVRQPPAYYNIQYICMVTCPEVLVSAARSLRDGRGGSMRWLGPMSEAVSIRNASTAPQIRQLDTSDSFPLSLSS